MSMLGEYFFSLMTDKRNGVAASLFKIILTLLSLVYRSILCLRRWGYAHGILRKHTVGRPVLSIGNITCGGVGKTPLVETIAHYIKERHARPVILLRGYKGRQDKTSSDKAVQCDEAMLLRASLGDTPVVVGKDRVQGAWDIMKKYPADIFLLDDGFQHWRLGRDLDIVAIDAVNPFGNGCLIPRGILREPLEALSRADIFVITKSDLGKQNVPEIMTRLQSLRNDALIVEAVHRPDCLYSLNDSSVINLSVLRDKAVCSFCSIGDPQSFEMTLSALGAHLRKQFSFMDHHWYEQRDIEEIADTCRTQGIDTLITTTKDAVKLNRFASHFKNDLWCLVLKIKIEIVKGKDEFFDRINHLLQR